MPTELRPRRGREPHRRAVRTVCRSGIAYQPAHEYGVACRALCSGQPIQHRTPERALTCVLTARAFGDDMAVKAQALDSGFYPRCIG
jgi:hypothetical protein